MNQKRTSEQDIYTDPDSFREEVSSAALNDELESNKNIDSFLKKNKENMIPHNLPIHLDKLLKKKGFNFLSVPQYCWNTLNLTLYLLSVLANVVFCPQIAYNLPKPSHYT